MNWKLWLYGLSAALIGAAASAASNIVVLPTQFDGVTVKKLFVVAGLNALVSGFIGGLAYLKTHPLPDWNGTNRRNNVQTSAASSGSDPNKSIT